MSKQILNVNGDALAQGDHMITNESIHMKSPPHATTNDMLQNQSKMQNSDFKGPQGGGMQ